MDNYLASLLTEQVNSRTKEIDCCDTAGILELINAEDRIVPEAVGKEIPRIARAVDLIVSAIRDGGRLFYFGAGTSGRLGVLDASECTPTFGVSHDLIQGHIAGGDTALRNAVEDSEDSEDLGRDEMARLGITAADVATGIAAAGRPMCWAWSGRPRPWARRPSASPPIRTASCRGKLTSASRP